MAVIKQNQRKYNLVYKPADKKNDQEFFCGS